MRVREVKTDQAAAALIGADYAACPHGDWYHGVVANWAELLEAVRREKDGIDAAAAADRNRRVEVYAAGVTTKYSYGSPRARDVKDAAEAIADRLLAAKMVAAANKVREAEEEAARATAAARELADRELLAALVAKYGVPAPAKD
jgi:hypothetical protein